MRLADAGLKRSQIDGMLCGYSTISPHIMLDTLFAEHFGTHPGAQFNEPITVADVMGSKPVALPLKLLDC